MVKTKEIGRKSPRKPLRSGPLIKSTRRRSLLTAKASGSQANIRVVVRIRPTSIRETTDNYRTVVKPLNEQLLIFDPEEYVEAFYYRGVQQKCRDVLKRPNKNIQFSFDRVFDEANVNEEVFKDSTQGLINSLMDGCNCSVFVYGATGAGKTYTMLGSAPDQPGITFLTMDELFKAKARLDTERKFELCVSYLEVYNESVQDLLVNAEGTAAGGSGTSLQVQDSKFGVVVAGLTIKKINNADQLFNLLDKGNRNRTQHPTDTNAESSRSHAVFQVYLQMDIIATGQRRLAKLSMIDLAGSERGAATGCKGARFTEGANINKSLLALGNCINALADGLRHVPYRDSKLTRLLKDSLGGNCQTVMIANVSPSSFCYEDTYNTLKYANRAKKIKANVKKNVGIGDLHVSQYVKLLEERTAENERLKEDNERLKSELERLKIENGQIVLASNCSLPSPSIVNADGSGDQNKIDNDIEELRAIWADLCSSEERKRKIELNKKMLTSRSQFQEAETSRNGLYCNSFDQSKASAKTDAATIRFQSQIDTFDKELLCLQNDICKAKQDVKKLVADKPHVKKENETLMGQFIILRRNLENTEYEALYKLICDQKTRLETQLDRTTELLKPCFWIARKYGFVTLDMINQYELITEAPHSVTWRPSPLFDIQPNDIDLSDGIDSGVSSTTTLTNPSSFTPVRSPHAVILTPGTCNRFPSKRKLYTTSQSDVHDSDVDLDCTFSLDVHLQSTVTPNSKQRQQQMKTLQQLGNGEGSLTSLNSLPPSSKAKRLATPRSINATTTISSRCSPRLLNQQLQRYGGNNNNNKHNLPPQYPQGKLAAAQHGTMGTAPRFGTSSANNRGNRKPLATIATQQQQRTYKY